MGQIVLSIKIKKLDVKPFIHVRLSQKRTNTKFSHMSMFFLVSIASNILSLPISPNYNKNSMIHGEYNGRLLC